MAEEGLGPRVRLLGKVVVLGSQGKLRSKTLALVLAYLLFRPDWQWLVRLPLRPIPAAGKLFWLADQGWNKSSRRKQGWQRSIAINLAASAILKRAFEITGDDHVSLG